MRRLVGIAALALWMASPPVALAGNADAGAQLARQWCTSCHLVDDSMQGPDTAPPFPTIARRRAQNETWVRAWLMAPHPPMPNLNLSRQEIDDIVAYLNSLKPR